MRNIIRFFIFLFPALSFITTFSIFQFYKWNSYEAIAGSLFTIAFAITFYYEVFVSDKWINLKRTPEFWIATGMLVFYSCWLPFVGTVNYLVSISMNLARLLNDLLDVTAIIMYLLFSYAFLCRIITKK